MDTKKVINEFNFKQFCIQQDLCAMKVGTDGVLLGAWTLVGNNEKILDVGCGTGLISLMLAQKNLTAIIEAIDIDSGAVQQALINVANSKFKSQINIKQKNFDEYKNCRSLYDLIVSNPPFFVNSLKNPDEQRNIARHADALSMQMLLTNSHDLLVDGGRLSVIYPSNLKEQFLDIALSRNFNFYISRLTNVKPLPNKSPKRMLIELTKCDEHSRIKQSENFQMREECLVIEEGRHIYTDEYKILTKDYYLKF